MEKYLLVYYTEGKYLHHMRRFIEYFEYEEDVLEYIDNHFEKMIEFHIYKQISCWDITKLLYNRCRGDNENE